MKFLCVACDAPMRLTDTRGPDNGSMTVLFACPECGREMAMLTNSMETQMVRSLGVKIGGREVPEEPMAGIRSSLSDNDLAKSRTHEGELGHSTGQAATSTGSKCPFTGIVSEAYEASSAFTWSTDAEQRLENIPSMVRPMVRRGIEEYAREQGVTNIDADLMAAARSKFGM